MVTSIGQQQLESFRAFVDSSAESSGARRSTSEPDSSDRAPGDIVELSQQVFETLAAGVQDLKQADLNLASQRVRATRELLEITQQLLTQAGPEQRDTIVANIRDIGQALSGIGSQIEQIFGGAETEAAAAYRETLNLEYSFASISITGESANPLNNDELDIEQTIKQTQLIVASLKIEYTQTLSANNGPAVAQLLSTGQQFEDLLASFRNTLQDFQAALRSLLETFTEEQIQPEVPIDLLNKFLSSTLEVS